MIRVFLGLGSNDVPEARLAQGVGELQSRFGNLVTSPIFENLSDDGIGPPYLNMVVGLTTGLSPADLKNQLLDVEVCCGRVRGQVACALDIDILLMGDRVGVVDGVNLPHPDILARAYVLEPLALIAPELLHPVLQQSCACLWQAFTGPRNRKRLS